MQPTIEQVAAMAWDLVKDEADPLFSDCLKDHQDKLFYHARDVQKTGIADDAFELKVKEILADPTAAIAALRAMQEALERADIAEAIAEPEPAERVKRDSMYSYITTPDDADYLASQPASDTKPLAKAAAKVAKATKEKAKKEK